MKFSLSLALVFGLFGCVGDGEPLRVAGQRNALTFEERGNMAWGVGNGRSETLGHWGVGNGRTGLEVIDPAGQVLEGALEVSVPEPGTLEVSFAPSDGFTLPGDYRVARPDDAAELATFELRDDALDDANAQGEIVVVLEAP